MTKNGKHRRKLIAPIVIAGLLILYYVGLGIVLGSLPGLPVWGVALAIVLPLAVVGVTLFVVIERIKEIRSGEEDDLSQY